VPQASHPPTIQRQKNARNALTFIGRAFGALPYEVTDAGLDGAQYVVCSYAEGLGRHPALGPYSELDRAFLEMPYSYGRHYVVDALSVTDPRFSGTRAVDCLWDAEPLIRVAAASAVDLGSPEATARLRALAADPAEEATVRSAADRV
jgi:hypothetical protein